MLYEGLQEKETAYHLSGLMCPYHRTEIFDHIRQALRCGKPCRVISTQLVEAGVDVDFPAVFRAAAGIDSLAQAAGRCNREGIMPEAGQVFFFTPLAGLPIGYLRQTAQTAESVMRHHEDPLSLEAVYEYFQSLYWLRGDKLDAYQILKDLLEGSRLGDFPFRVVAEKYRIIRDRMEPIIIPWNHEARGIINELTYSSQPGFSARRAQRYTIHIPPRVLYSLEAAGSAIRIREQYCVLANMDLYRDDTGLCVEDPSFREVEGLIV